MNKFNLPVILLKGIVLLPHNEIKLEFSKDDSLDVLQEAESFHNKKILIISSDKKPNEKTLPTMGVLAKLNQKIELPNGHIRIIISGLNRAKVVKYLNNLEQNEVLESIVEIIKEDKIDEKEEKILVAKLKKEISEHVKKISYMSNSIINEVNNISSLSKLTDIIMPILSINLDRQLLYLKTSDVKERLNMILEDIYEEDIAFSIEKELDIKVKRAVDKNQREYFLREKLKIVKQELGDISTKDEEIDKLKIKIDKLKCPKPVKEKLASELKRYETLSSASPELNIVRGYIDWVINLPWNIFTEDNEDLKEVKQILDDSHFGLEKVKTRILEFLAVKQLTNTISGPILCLVGPPGVGKTSLAKTVALAMKRAFVKMSVGGLNDEAELIGHRRTYLGASPGKIISSLKKAKAANPVFLIDEVDKMTKDIKGDPASVLLEVLDPEQNMFFTDNYIEEEFDLSKVLFILTANYIEQIPEALKDRLEIIKISGYTEFEKIDIAKKHLIPATLKEHGLENITFSDDIIKDIIRKYTKEAGVRDLKRQLATIMRKIVTEVITDKKEFKPVFITTALLTKYLGKAKYEDFGKLKESTVGIVNGLAYTPFGGDTLPIEVNFYKGKGEIKLTGSLGDVMKESASVAFSYVKANYKQFKLNYEDIKSIDIHIHVPEGAVPKDGPSAGIAITSALISALGEIKVSSAIAMTGEITLRGDVLPIGGLREKSIGAYRQNIKKIIIPYDNMRDLQDIPEEIKENITYLPVKTYAEVYEQIVGSEC
jgi:ATP-dependent Lon protease